MKEVLPTSEIEKIVSPIKTWNPVRSNQIEPFLYIDLRSIDQKEKRIVATSKILPKEAPSRARQLVREGDVLVSTVRPNLNGVAYVSRELDGATASTGFCVLRPKQGKLVGRYLYHWVQSPQFVEEMVKFATGANYPAVSDRIIKDSQIPLPLLEEQKRIAAILDKAVAIRRKRQQAIRLAADFLSATFLDMFGDPVTNPKEWKEELLNDIAEIVSGVTKGRKFNGKKTIYIPYMRVANIQDGHIDLREIKEIEALETDIEKYALRYGDILLTEGGDPDKLGRGSVWRAEVEPCIHQNHIFRVRSDNTKVLPEYLSALIGSSRGKRYFLRAAKQTTGIASINMTQLKGFPVLLPPITLQDKYIDIVRKYENHSRSLNDLVQLNDNLFNSLTQHAFRGKL